MTSNMARVCSESSNISSGWVVKNISRMYSLGSRFSQGVWSRRDWRTRALRSAMAIAFETVRQSESNPLVAPAILAAFAHPGSVHWGF